MKVRRQWFDAKTGESGTDEVEMPDVITPEEAAANDAAQSQADADDRATWATLRDRVNLLAVDPPRSLSNAQRDQAIATLALAVKRLAKRMHTEFD